ncbi:pirin family protein [Taibaiella soli]|uniref:Pirin family protein n=1 Tax=Taibaiella soli TaxID=1649169 RepID=A0A2W2A677_9BACT|nr:pirin-like bicupin family protein [Taibaiella soli]PZF70755.1 pirin family protein [Taibaiella soli]
MAQYIFHKSDSRHHEYNDWLDSKKTFSFADYYNPKRMNFGALRVFNDDILVAGKGFGNHPHDNMEIISIPLTGSLKHKDNLGNEKIISAGQSQIMSTGSGVFHSEYNNEPDGETRFLQIWIYPNELNTSPRYQEVALPTEKGRSHFEAFIAPQASETISAIQQNAWMSIGNFEKHQTFNYPVHLKGNGIYLYVITGAIEVDGHQLIEVDGHQLSDGDGLGITEIDHFSGKVNSENAQLLVIEVPMQF